MTSSTSVNDQITDATTQNSTQVVSESSTVSAASTYQTIAHSMGTLFHDAVATQQRQNMASQAANSTGLGRFYQVKANKAAKSVMQNPVKQESVLQQLSDIQVLLAKR